MRWSRCRERPKYDDEGAAQREIKGLPSLTIARIRFEHFQNGKGIKRIARELGVARDTVRKVLRSGSTQFTYKREVQPKRKLGPWVEALTTMLEAVAAARAALDDAAFRRASRPGIRWRA